MRSRDTSPEAYALQQEIHGRMSPGRRLRLIIEMSERAREISIAGWMAREPGMTREEARMRVLRDILGDELFEMAYRKRGRA